MLILNRILKYKSQNNYLLIPDINNHLIINQFYPLPAPLARYPSNIIVHCFY